jgi:hypothetical protein
MHFAGKLERAVETLSNPIFTADLPSVPSKALSRSGRFLSITLENSSIATVKGPVRSLPLEARSGCTRVPLMTLLALLTAPSESATWRFLQSVLGYANPDDRQ